MKMTATLTAILFCLLPSTGTAPAQSRSVDQIRIISSWTGLGAGMQGGIVITRKAGAYLSDGVKVPDELIANLLSSIGAPAVAKTSLVNLGITQEWLDANAEKAIKQYAGEYLSSANKDQRALYFSSFKDPKFIEEKILPRLYDSFHTDDYPKVDIEITETDGRVIKVSSRAQPLFMLPWVISRDGIELKTYNADIARAVASLMPDKFANRERLSGESLGYELAEAVMFEIRDRWESLKAKRKTRR
jgi:hypothetical protein